MFSTLISRFKKVNKDDIIQLIDEINNNAKELETTIHLSSDIYNPNFLKIDDENIDGLLEHFDCLDKNLIDRDCYYFVYDGYIQSMYDSTVYMGTDLESLLEMDYTIVNKNLEIVDISNGKVLDENKFISILYFNVFDNTFKFISKNNILIKVFDSNDTEVTEWIDDLESVNKYYFDYDFDNGYLYYYRKSNIEELIDTDFYIGLKYLGK